MSTPITPIRVVLLNAVTTGTSGAVSLKDYVAPALYIIGTGTISTGTLVVEEADWDESLASTYAGTWSTIYFIVPPATTAVSAIDLTALTGGSPGKQQSLKLRGPNAYGYFRVRVGTDVTGAGGTVTVVLRETV